MPKRARRSFEPRAANPPPEPPPAGVAGWVERLFIPVDIASLAFFRIAFGLLMLCHLLAYLGAGRLERLYFEPVFFFKFFGFEWVRPLPDAWLKGLFVLLAVLSLAVAAGLFYRAACGLLFFGYTYVFLLDEADYQNHTYLICLLLLVLTFVPAHRAFSLDAWRRPAWRSESVPAWALWLLRFHVALPYTLGGINKLNYDWLVRAEPMGIWLREGTEGPFRAAFLKEPWAAYAMSWGGALYDLAVIPLLLWPRTRKAAFVVTLLFHLANSQLFSIGIFPWLMIAGSLLFFPPDWPRRLRLFGVRRKASRPIPVPRGAARTATVALLAGYCTLQVLLPFRHFLYPGPVDWTEEGHQFSWRMKLRDKRGEVRFIGYDPGAGKAFPLSGLDAALTERQRIMMLHDPQMIRQTARYLAGQLAGAGYGNVQIRAVTSISLNGRRKQPMVDPKVDLAAEGEGWGGAPWIVPLAR